jgi:hypothetical protein
MRFPSFLILFGLLAVNPLAGAEDLLGVSLRAGDPVNPTNPFVACLKERIVKNFPDYNFHHFLGSESMLGDIRPAMRAKTDFLLVDRKSGVEAAFKVVLTSTAADRGWQLFTVNEGVVLWSASVSPKVEFSQGGLDAPLIATFSVEGCPSH